MTTTLSPQVVVKTPSEMDPDDLNHFYDPDEWPYAWCGFRLKESDPEVTDEEIDCPKCLNMWFESMMESDEG